MVEVSIAMTDQYLYFLPACLPLGVPYPKSGQAYQLDFFPSDTPYLISSSLGLQALVLLIQGPILISKAMLLYF
jgi:hypothetical protein